MKHRDGTAERRHEIYRDALVVIGREYSRDLQVDDVARSVASSRRQLQRIFAEVGDTSFRELLATARMKRARILLAEDGNRIQDVAAEVGYHQSAQFSKSFRRHFGISPREYRARLRSGAAPESGRLDLPRVATLSPRPQASALRPAHGMLAAFAHR